MSETNWLVPQTCVRCGEQTMHDNRVCGRCAAPGPSPDPTVEGLADANRYADRQSKPFAPIEDDAQAREAKERLIRAIFKEPTEEDVLYEAKQMCDEDEPCEVCMAIAGGGAHSGWLAARDAAQQSIGAERALREAAKAVELQAELFEIGARTATKELVRLTFNVAADDLRGVLKDLTDRADRIAQEAGPE